MLSLKTTARILLSFVLLFVFSTGSNELRVSVGTIFLWGLGLIFHRRNSLSLKHLFIFVATSFWLLAAKNELFFESTLGRVLGLLFTRPSYDSDTPGSGFTDWHERLARRHRHDINLVWSTFCATVRTVFAVAAFFSAVVLCHWYAALPERMPGLTESIEYLDKTGEFPPWLSGARVLAPEPLPLPTRDMRYLTLADDLAFIVGPGNDPFERVVNGKYDNTFWRRRRHSMQFS
ncbi:hypothetical protein HBI26_187710 [Parastagonospora nodorum]|nr:hypothetical protein HBH50_073310 [Parastagonospora nodorum]KAH4095042.1 hypothetical protein HBH48_061570 [Parastagonospora nodorum]KAH4268049.1 hypothetical protein HBI03_056520 [Parastagonospora nodorum]KAH4278926.1 hypothetical protein HBI04_071970 [Parastagonospora nodorum]KAH4967458.1 hypothetical protein HBI78_069890 [Parastagonospora nodorum]